MRDKGSNRNGVQKTTNEDIFNCSSQRIYLCELNIIRFICVLLLFRVCMCCGWCCQNWMSNYNNNNRIWANSREREKWMGPLCHFAAVALAIAPAWKQIRWMCESTNCWINSAHLFRWTMHLTSLSSSLVNTVFLHNMLCTARLLHLHNAHTHT